MHTTHVFGLLLALPAFALATPFAGSYTLEGRYSNRRATQVELEIRSTAGTIEVTRTGSFTSRRHRDKPAFTWASSDVRVKGKRLVVTYRVPAAQAGVLQGLQGTTPQNDYEFTAFYRLSQSGTVSEFLSNRTRRGAHRWWRYAASKGPRATQLSQADLLSKAKEHVLANAGTAGQELYPSIHGQEEGLDAVLLFDDHAEDLMGLFAADEYAANSLDFPFDPSTQALLVARDSPYVEKSLFVSLVDKATGTITYKGQYDLYAMAGGLELADFERFVGPAADFDFSKADEYVDDYEVSSHIGRDGVRVDLGNPKADW